jgi:hypothetical protein
MKCRFFAQLVMLAAAAYLVPSASATWSGFRSLGKTPVVGEPSCVQGCGQRGDVRGPKPNQYLDGQRI